MQDLKNIIVREYSQSQNCRHRHSLYEHIESNIRCKNKGFINDWIIFESEINLDDFINANPELKPFVRYA